MKKILFTFICTMAGFIILQAQTIKINEFMASNATTISDPYGEFDDWIELYNYGNDTVDIGGFYITDKLDNPTKHMVPTGYQVTKIPPKGFLVLWADNDTLQDGPLHLKFKLSANGEAIGVFAPNGLTPLDTLSFGQQITDISYGRYPDGNNNWVYFNYPTPGASNSLVSIENLSQQISFSAYPNPVRGHDINFSKTIDFELFNIQGQHLGTYFSTNVLNTGDLPQGAYFIKSFEGESIRILVLD